MIKAHHLALKKRAAADSDDVAAQLASAINAANASTSTRTRTRATTTTTRRRTRTRTRTTSTRTASTRTTSRRLRSSTSVLTVTTPTSTSTSSPVLAQEAPASEASSSSLEASPSSSSILASASTSGIANSNSIQSTSEALSESVSSAIASGSSASHSSSLPKPVSTAVIVVASTVGGAILLAAILFLLCRRRKRRREEEFGSHGSPYSINDKNGFENLDGFENVDYPEATSPWKDRPKSFLESIQTSLTRASESSVDPVAINSRRQMLAVPKSPLSLHEAHIAPNTKHLTHDDPFKFGFGAGSTTLNAALAGDLSRHPYSYAASTSNRHRSEYSNHGPFVDAPSGYSQPQMLRPS